MHAAAGSDRLPHPPLGLDAAGVPGRGCHGGARHRKRPGVDPPAPRAHPNPTRWPAPTSSAAARCWTATSAFWPQIGRPHTDAAAIRRSVDEMAERGADAVKLYVHLTTEQIGAAATQADRRNLPLLAHLGPSVDLATAVSAGVREVQHLTGCVHHVEGWRTNVDEVAASAASLATAGVAQCPTLVVWDRLCRLNDTAFRHDRRDRWVHPDDRRGLAALPAPHRRGRRPPRPPAQRQHHEAGPGRPGRRRLHRRRRLRRAVPSPRAGVLTAR